MNSYDKAKRILDILQLNGYEAYFVGGCVRDKFMGKEPKDYDICTSALPDDIVSLAIHNDYRCHLEGKKYGTIKIHDDGEDFEVTTFRAESGYRDKRHPSAVNFLQTIDGDLSRRDLTINSLAYNPSTNEYIDLFGGKADIKDKIIKAVGDADERFKEDPLRILRALRFAIVYKFNIEENTLNSMKSNAELLNTVSKERITEELRKILTSGKPITKHFLECSCIIAVIFPEITPCIGFDQNNRYHKHNVFEHLTTVTDLCKSNKFEIKLAALLHDIGKPASYIEDEEGRGHFYGHPVVSHDICKDMLPLNLRLSRNELDLTLKLVAEHDARVSPTTTSVRRFLNKHGLKFMRDWMILKQADLDDHINLNANLGCISTEDVEKVLDTILAEESCFKLKDLKINGKDIMQITNGKSGKHIGKILSQLMNEVISDKIPNNHKDLMLRADVLWKESIENIADDLYDTDDNDEEEFSSEIAVVIAQKGFVYTNAFMLNEESLVKRKLLRPNYASLDVFQLERFPALASRINSIDIPVIVYEAEKYIDDNNTLMDLLIDNGVDIAKVAIIPDSNTVISNCMDDSGIKFANKQYVKPPTINDVEVIIKKYKYEPEKYHLKALLLYNLMKCSREYNINNNEVNIIATKQLNDEIQGLKNDIANRIEGKLNVYYHTNMFIQRANEAVMLPNKVKDELISINDTDTYELVKKIMKRKTALGKVVEKQVTVAYNKDKTNYVSARDNIYKYSNPLERIKDKYYLVQLETVYYTIGMSINDSLKAYDITEEDLKIYDESSVEHKKQATALQTMLYANSDESVTYKDKKKYMSELIGIIKKLNKEGMLVAYIDNLTFWILVPRSIDKNKAITNIRSIIINSYIDKSLYRMHICMDGNKRKLFTPYNDEYTIQEYQGD